MAKRKTELTENKIEKYMKEGRGQGERGNYKPWITIQDVPSKGLCTRGTGWKTSRIHHFLSNLERDFFYMCEWETDVIDIREQFPLNRLDTIAIAEKKRIKHPADPKTSAPIVMTTDFLLTIKTADGFKYIARTIKPSVELEKKRVLEKFEIERHYWNERNIEWAIVTEKEILKPLVQNIEWLHSSYNLNEFLPSSLYKVLSEELKYELQLKETPIIEILSGFENKWNLEKGLAISLFQHLISIKEIEVDIEMPIRLERWTNDLLLNVKNNSEKGVGESVC
jgi:TnsA endonuclease N terminal/TnsA endonuclease C terminal